MRASDITTGLYFKLATDDRILKRLAYDQGVYAVDADNNLVGVHPDSSCELALPPGSDGALRFKIKHHSKDIELSGRVAVGPNGLDIFFDGYGTMDMEPGFGAPLFIEPDDNGHPQIFAWTEIDNDDFTHKVCLQGARDTREPTPV